MWHFQLCITSAHSGRQRIKLYMKRIEIASCVSNEVKCHQTMCRTILNLNPWTFFDFFKHHRITGRPFIIVKLWFLVTTTFPSSSQPHLEVCVRVGVPISTIEVKHHLAAAPATHSKVSSKAFFVDDKKPIHHQTEVTAPSQQQVPLNTLGFFSAVCFRYAIF